MHAMPENLKVGERPRNYELRPKSSPDGSLEGDMLEVSMGRSIPRRMAYSGWTWCWMASGS